MFKFLDKHKHKKQTKDVANNVKALWDADFDDIWKSETKGNLLIALGGWLCKKGNYGNNIDKLSAAEKCFYLVYQLEGEINNGGFSQFFYNSSGDFANDTAAALREIGADKAADIYDKALAAFGGTVSKNRSERNIRLNDAISNSIIEILNQCDIEFYKYPDDLLELNYQFVMHNRTQFIR